MAWLQPSMLYVLYCFHWVWNSTLATHCLLAENNFQSLQLPAELLMETQTGLKFRTLKQNRGHGGEHWLAPTHVLKERAEVMGWLVIMIRKQWWCQTDNRAQIHWYRWKRAACDHDKKTMMVPGRLTIHNYSDRDGRELQVIMIRKQWRCQQRCCYRSKRGAGLTHSLKWLPQSQKIKQFLSFCMILM